MPLVNLALLDVARALQASYVERPRIPEVEILEYEFMFLKRMTGHKKYLTSVWFDKVKELVSTMLTRIIREYINLVAFENHEIALHVMPPCSA